MQRFILLFNLCLWFHDAIYDPRASDNEARSNDLFLEFARDVSLPEEDTRRVTWVILDTIGHKMQHGDVSDRLYADLC